MEELVSAINKYNESNNSKFSFNVTGGALSYLEYLGITYGLSNTLTSAYVPYSCEATQEKIGSITSYVSDDVAKKLADKSLQECQSFLTTSVNTIVKLNMLYNATGIGVTCSLVSGKNGKPVWKRGEHRMIACISTCDKYIIFSLTLYKGDNEKMKHFRSRQEEDNLCGKLIVCICAYKCGIFNNDTLMTFMYQNGLDPKDTLVISSPEIKKPIDQLLSGDVKNVLCLPQSNGIMQMIPNVDLSILGKYTENKPVIKMLSGSFNPLHDGHLAMLKNISSTEEGLFELSIFNVDKPPIDKDNINSRLVHFITHSQPIIVTNAPRYIDKAKMFPGIVHMIGVDTAFRLVDPKYTNNNIDRMTQLLLNMTDEGTRFNVFPRTIQSCKMSAIFPDSNPTDLATYSMIKSYVPLSLQTFFIEIENNLFINLSSSALRK